MTPNKLVFKLYNTQDIYHMAQNFCGSFIFLHIGDFFCVLRNYSLRQKQLGHFSQMLFFPFSCSPCPSQSCLSRFGHQILYTNIEGTRRPQSVPTILTETVFQRNFEVCDSSLALVAGNRQAGICTFRSHFFGKNIRDFTDRKREDNQQRKEVFVSLITTFRSIKKSFLHIGFKE